MEKTAQGLIEYAKAQLGHLYAIVQGYKFLIHPPHSSIVPKTSSISPMKM